MFRVSYNLHISHVYADYNIHGYMSVEILQGQVATKLCTSDSDWQIVAKLYLSPDHLQLNDIIIASNVILTMLNVQFKKKINAE